MVALYPQFQIVLNEILGTLKTLKTHSYHFEDKKRENELCPLSMLAFHQLKTVDKEPFRYTICL